MVGTATRNLSETHLVNRTGKDAQGAIVVCGDIAVTFETFDNELYKIWQHIDASSIENAERLKD